MTLKPLHKNVLVLETPQDVAEAAAEKFVKLAQSAIEANGRFSVALAGGNTPKLTYETIAAPPVQNRIDWARVHLFFGDERHVPLDHPDSNFRMASDALISRVPIPSVNVHHVQIQNDPSISSRLYEEELKRFFPGLRWPRFDLVFLGLGADGHTASLFPDSAALAEKIRWVVANWIEKLGVHRITLTVSAINNAANVIFVVTGAEKADTVATILRGGNGRLPAQLVKPVQGSLVWLIDRDAARKT